MPAPVRRSKSRGAKQVLSPSEAVPEQNIITAYRWGWYLLSFFIPFMGIILALLLFDQDSREVRKVGRNCLFLSFLVWVVFPVLVFLALIFLGAMAALSWLSDVMPSND